MPEPFTGNRRALAYFGTIRGLTANRATTQEIWLGRHEPSRVVGRVAAGRR